jgi:CHAD domain-containing protein
MNRALVPPVLDPRRPIAENAARIIGFRIDELLALERHIRDPLRVAELHEMRIAAKRLRYTLEIFAPLYGAELTAAIESVKSIQEQLGAIHDTDVLVPEIVAHVRRELRPDDDPASAGVFGFDLDAAAGMIAMCRRRRAARQSTYRAFLRDWSALRRVKFFPRLRELVGPSTAARRTPTATGGGRHVEDKPNPNHPDADPAAG